MRRHSWAAAALASVCALFFGLLTATTSQAQPSTGTWYYLENRNSGKVLDVSNRSTDNGAGLIQYSNTGGTHQQFRFVSSGDGYYRIQARHSGKVLDVYEWNADNGAQIVQWDDLGGTNQQFRAVETGDGYYRFINRFSGKALDVWEWSTADGARISQYDDTGGTNQQFRLVPVSGGNPQPPGGLEGWATQNGGTTGGAGGSTVTVSNADQLRSALSSSSAMTIQVSGTISWSGMNRVQSNKTIIGLGSNATISGGGLNISGARNVIIRNITFRNWDDDAINIQESSTNIWVDHNTFTNGYDGAVDIKRESDYITVSWNRFYNHGKTMLLGHSDSHTADVGNLRVTYHHNWFDGTDTRHPRVRFGNPVHVYNNYYYNNEYGVASTMNAGVLVEGNYFENVDEPTLVGYGSSGPGSLVQRNNYFTGSGSPQSSGSTASIPYSYRLDSASSVKSIVTAGAGAGRI
ncbi:RICIN domain-containing protein [Streptomyces sp. YIM 98790]|uniref:pectate lyase family protein n=1 Tax=Streptomyces sp. YIM 98790 TaxID=2689077 RepID=UPI001A9F5E91|nr:RICIN domain-containing protein [Streptomyces sp. YIM 98790]